MIYVGTSVGVVLQLCSTHLYCWLIALGYKFNQHATFVTLLYSITAYDALQPRGNKTRHYDWRPIGMLHNVVPKAMVAKAASYSQAAISDNEILFRPKA